MFDVEDMASQTTKENQYNLDWIKNNDLKRAIESNFFTKPEKLKEKGIDLNDYQKVVQMKRLIESMNGKFFKNDMRWINDWFRDADLAMQSFIIARQFGSLIVAIDKNMSKLPKLNNVYFDFDTADSIEVRFKGNCEALLNDKLSDELAKWSHQIVYDDKHDVTMLYAFN